MAILAATALTAGTAPVLAGPLAWLTVGMASFVDARFIMPALAGKGREQAQTPRLAGLPVGSNEPGAPRIWAIGNRVRVPCHVMWQSRKVRETTPNHKGSSGIVQRRVFISALISLNDRETASMNQLVGNGKLLVWNDRNLTEVRTSQMSAAQYGGSIRITMASNLDPDLADTFKVNSVVKLSGFVPAPGTPELIGYWGIFAVSHHAIGAPSSMVLVPADNQVVTGVSCTGGSPFAPALIERVDDAMVEAGSGVNAQPGAGYFLFSPSYRDPREVFSPGDRVLFRDQYQQYTARIALFDFYSGGWRVQMDRGSYAYAGPAVPGTWDRIEFNGPNRYPASLFPLGFDPAEHFHPGDDTQLPDSLIEGVLGIGNASAYRGLAYQGLEEFEVTQFGNALPLSLEAIITVDPGMTWPDALQAVLLRAGVPEHAIDVSGITADPFGGFYLRGSAPTVTAIQPLLVARQVVTQERDGVISIFEIQNADVVQIENGPARTALGARRDGEQATDDKIARESIALEDLPTSIGIRHQDPDNAHAPGYQTFGLRHPTGVTWQNNQEVDLSNVSLTRKEARNLATTMLRRAWTNSTRVSMTLDPRYIDLLENDLVTVTDDDGNDLVVRLLRVDVGANFLVEVSGVVEDVDLQVYGSPVQSAVDTYTPPPVRPAELEVAVLDLPPLTEQDAAIPTILIACGARPGSTFQGAQAFESRDGGASWVPAEIFDVPHSIGVITTAMAAGAPAEAHGTPVVTVDTATVIEVDLSSLGLYGAPASVHEIEARLAGRNWCAIQNLGTGRWEVCAFTTVLQTGPQTFELSGWLRGLRGTQAECAEAKPAGGQFVMLTDWEATGRRRTTNSTLMTPALLYRFVPVGATLDDVASVGITPAWHSVRPFPVRDISKAIGDSPYDVRFSFSHWTRQPLALGALGPYELDESYESYEFRIYSPNGLTLLRTFTLTAQGSGSSALRDRFVDYPAADQVVDGYTPGPTETFWVDCVQIGDEQRYGPSNKQEL